MSTKAMNEAQKEAARARAQFEVDAAGDVADDERRRQMIASVAANIIARGEDWTAWWQSITERTSAASQLPAQDGVSKRD